MKLTAAREDVLAPLQSVIGVVERRQTMPVLANVLLSARENRLSVTGTDLEVELVATSQVTVPQPGDITDQRCEWKLRRAHVEPVVLEPLDNAPPRRTVRPRSMNKHDRRLGHVFLSAGDSRHAPTPRLGAGQAESLEHRQRS